MPLVIYPKGKIPVAAHEKTDRDYVVMLSDFHDSSSDSIMKSATHHQDTAYIHWYMSYDFKMLGRSKTMASYGISQIKINEQQKIIFQQDYWDPANGLYRSLPIFGGVYKWILPFKKVES